MPERQGRIVANRARWRGREEPAFDYGVDLARTELLVIQGGADAFDGALSCSQNISPGASKGVME